jgi:hypothetical protein
MIHRMSDRSVACHRQLGGSYKVATASLRGWGREGWAPDERPVRQQVLGDGDEIRIGHTRMRFQKDD